MAASGKTVDPAGLRTGRIGLVLVVLAGAAATLAGVVALRLLRPYLLPLLPDTTSALAFAWIETIGDVGLWFAIVNMLPLPPLTGAHLLVAMAPQWRDRLCRTQPQAAVLLAALAVAGVFTRLLGPVYAAKSRRSGPRTFCATACLRQVSRASATQTTV